MTDQHAQSQLSSLGTLLDNPKFSDLVLRCQGQKFDVHQCIVCLNSPVFASACGGGFQEAKTKVIDVIVADVPTLKRLLKYLYTHDYDDGNESSLAAEQTESIATLDPNMDENYVQIIDSSDDKTDHAHEEPLDKMNINHVLKANVQVCVAADYYQIPGLMRLAVKKFEKASTCMEFYQPGFADVLAFVYESTNTTCELRSILCLTMVRNAASLISDKSFMNTAARLSGCLEEVLSALVTDYERKLESKGDRIKALNSESFSLRAEAVTRSAENANLQARLQAAEDAAADVRRKVNESKQCRHCNEANTVYFEYDNSLRCVCRTRY
ncbi:MAG: hypothetical protein Q9167_001906 [Letrouitia subvulpina]